MELRDALLQIGEIRDQLSRAGTFRGYRSATVAFSGAVAVVAGVIQSIVLPDPQGRIEAYLLLWGSAAGLSLFVVACEMAIRCRSAASSFRSRTTLLAVEQFLPCLFAGAIVTAALYATAPEGTWLLPGLWGIVFSLGVFASWRLLPPATFWVGAFYLLAGGACLAFARAEHALSPWAMIGTFGGGQFLTAVILYRTLERHDDSA
ncbi:MAG: hypothetical protein WD066_16955 [Planctomycetaceae bacterium]